jgi:hypothetical protein
MFARAGTIADGNLSTLAPVTARGNGTSLIFILPVRLRLRAAPNLREV